METILPKEIKIIRLDSYLQTIKNSLGTGLFRNLFAEVDGKRMDILKNGGLSCPVFVSSILYLHKLCSDIHATVDGTTKDIKAFGWEEVKTPRVGAVLVWESAKTTDHSGDVYPHHQHIGFYVDEESAISNSASVGYPVQHHWTFGLQDNNQPIRKVEKIFWYKKLEK